MKRLIYLVLLLFILTIPFACAVSFCNDPAAINETANSVLMLEIYDDDYELIATGSGFVAFSNRYLVTNYHVIEGASTIVGYSDIGDMYMVNRVLAADEEKDIAILCFFSPTDLTPLALNESGTITRAEPVVAIGSPKGFINTVSMGNVSAAYAMEGTQYIQFTAPISSGSSGGALFNDSGLVIGITTSVYDDRSGVVQNLNFAVNITEIINLYQANKDNKLVYLSDFQASYLVTASPAPTATPTPKPATASPSPATATPSLVISGLTASQTGMNSVTLQFSDTSAISRKYYYSYECDGNTYYNYDISFQKKILISNLIPGRKYTFYVATSEALLDKQQTVSGSCLRVTFTLSGAEKYTQRGYYVNSKTLFYVATDVDAYDSSRKSFTTVSLADLKKYATTRDYFLQINYDVNSVSSDTVMNYLWVLTAPDKQVYTGYYQDELTKKYQEGARMALYFDNQLSECERFSGIKTGTYTVDVYINGQFALTKSFTVE